MLTLGLGKIKRSWELLEQSSASLQPALPYRKISDEQEAEGKVSLWVSPVGGIVSYSSGSSAVQEADKGDTIIHALFGTNNAF